MVTADRAFLSLSCAHYDLAIVAAVLAADYVIPAAELRRRALLGELMPGVSTPNANPFWPHPDTPRSSEESLKRGLCANGGV